MQVRQECANLHHGEPSCESQEGEGGGQGVCQHQSYLRQEKAGRGKGDGGDEENLKRVKPSSCA